MAASQVVLSQTATSEVLMDAAIGRYVEDSRTARAKLVQENGMLQEEVIVLQRSNEQQAKAKRNVVVSMKQEMMYLKDSERFKDEVHQALVADHAKLEDEHRVVAEKYGVLWKENMKLCKERVEMGKVQEKKLAGLEALRKEQEDSKNVCSFLIAVLIMLAMALYLVPRLEFAR